MAQGNEIRRKTYVSVFAIHKLEGPPDPTHIVWRDGRVFRIAKVLDVRRAAAYHSGTAALRYHIMVGSTRTFLYYQQPRWFVEAIVRE